jgi:16S rRNA (adenine1518-N6/adenine1519-N6)-dimethyltransferase|tara:strand:- start:96911 stop:97675 length:765 start_codon:yes stop_codon:yes gene_type:complete
MVRAKKHLGQHFLKDQNIAKRIADSLKAEEYDAVLEIGPGTGVLTQFLIPKFKDLTLIELDRESVEYLHENYPSLKNKIIGGDFLKMPVSEIFKKQFAIIGNFPYNISTQIVFKTLENKELIPEFAGMFQKEVAERIVAGPGSKTYGIMSVLVAAYYHAEYLFTVEPEVFNPPPKVKSGVIRLSRKEDYNLDCDEKLFYKVVKMAFNQRRKTLRNALKSLNLSLAEDREELLGKRAEQLSLEDFIFITKSLETP